MKDTENSPYFWWYEYLKCHEGYERCCSTGGKGRYASLYRDFGNIHRLTFSEWWKSRSELFTGPKLEPFTFHPITSELQYRLYSGDDTVLIVAINLFTPKRQLEREFRSLLRKAYPRRRGRPARDHGLAEYALNGWPKMSFLKTALNVWKEHGRSAPNTPLWKIALNAGVGRAYKKYGASAPDAIDRHKLAGMARRYIKQAGEVIENAAKGQFPKYATR
jgi:hypothetical protein